MSAASVQRQVALAGIALLAAIVALVLTAHDKGQAITGIPQPVPVAGGDWYSALAGAELPRYGRRTRCGYVLKPSTVGVTDSVLPCGILVYVAYKDSPQILTRVIDRRPVLPGRKFDLTPKLAEELGIDGVQRIRWVFAQVTRRYNATTRACACPGHPVEPTPSERELSFDQRLTPTEDAAPTWLVQVHHGPRRIGRLETRRGDFGPPVSPSPAKGP